MSKFDQNYKLTNPRLSKKPKHKKHEDVSTTRITMELLQQPLNHQSLYILYMISTNKSHKSSFINPSQS